MKHFFKIITVGIYVTLILSKPMVVAEETLAHEVVRAESEEVQSAEYHNEIRLGIIESKNNIYENIRIKPSLINHNCIEFSEQENAKEEVEEIAEEVVTNRWQIVLNEEEIELLAKIVWLESRGESNLGQQAVVEIIFNRVTSKDFPNTLYDVLSSPGQFTTWGMVSTATPTEKEYSNIEEVLSGNTEIFGFEYVYFAAHSHSGHTGMVQIGGHQFCPYY